MKSIPISILIFSALATFCVCSADTPPTRVGEMGMVNQNSLLPFAPPPQRFGTHATLFETIIYCESSGNPNAKNPNSTARGLLQVIKSSEEWCEVGLKRDLDMYNEKDNLDCGEYLLEHQGLSAWNASRECWDKELEN